MHPKENVWRNEEQSPSLSLSIKSHGKFHCLLSQNQEDIPRMNIEWSGNGRTKSTKRLTSSQEHPKHCWRIWSKVEIPNVNGWLHRHARKMIDPHVKITRISLVSIPIKLLADSIRSLLMVSLIEGYARGIYFTYPAYVLEQPKLRSCLQRYFNRVHLERWCFIDLCGTRGDGCTEFCVPVSAKWKAPLTCNHYSLRS